MSRKQIMQKFIFLSIFVFFVLLSCKSEKKVESAPDSTLINQFDVDAPEWYKQVPQSDDFIYGKGVAHSAREAIARDKALLIAQTELAKKISRDSLDSQVVMLKNGILKEQKTVRDGNRWRVYVLMEMPIEKESNK